MSILLLGLNARATDRNWTGGGGADNHWMTAANWQGSVAPVAGDNLIFGGVSMAGSQSNNNNFPAGTIFGKITLSQASGQNFILGGNQIVITNGLTVLSSGLGIMALSGIVYLNMSLGADQIFYTQHGLDLKGTLDLNNHFLTISNLGALNIYGVVTNAQVNGSVNLDGATLNLVPGYSAVPGTAFLILINLSANPTTGTFAGLPEGAVFAAGGQYFSITYKAGTGGNDVVVTAVNQPPVQPGFTKINISGGTVQLQGTGTSNVNYTLQANTNLLTTNWQNIGTVTPNGSGAFSFSTSNAFAFPQRFFRLVVP